MSRREDRDSDSKRHRSRFDREPSPKRSKRDGKPEMERATSNRSFDNGDSKDGEKQRRRLQDALPLEEPSAALDSKTETGVGNKESVKRSYGFQDGTKPSSDPTEVPRSRSYFQHDERGTAGQVGRSIGRRPASVLVSCEERGWWHDSKDKHGDRAANKTESKGIQQRDDHNNRGGDNRAWRHDGYFELEADPALPVRKRPAFREKKLPADPVFSEKAAATEPIKTSQPDQPISVSERKEERGHSPRRFDRSYVGYRARYNRGESYNGGFSSRYRYGAGSNNRGGDKFDSRQGHRSSGGGHVEKWKHDLFDEANQSPKAKNEEEQIAKVEALLAS
ncbi:hypothetical protein RJ641_019189 [Dillenia turbinata]|uniref:Btz domain-containing protein n=1 Tax=Dillenia turbinata TaxID=194707 RepID=A0AAN8UGE6_9MAGN